MKNRTIKKYIEKKAISKFGRIIVLTGARQTGKTTLIKKHFSKYKYISLEDPVLRPQYSSFSAMEWNTKFPFAILDEVQKIPTLIESIKSVYDQFEKPRYILLGSSQILLLKKIKESLAGRAALIELYPLTIPEMLTSTWDDVVKESRMIKWLKEGGRSNIEIFQGIPQNEPDFINTERVLKKYLQNGGMPAIVDDSLSSEEVYDWLYNYVQTYLQRDVRDLSNLKDLEPFVRALTTIAGLTGQIITYSHLAKLSGIAPPTAKRFVTYLELSYQVILLKPWFRNLHKRLSKSPKIHFIDPGIQRVLLSRKGNHTGNEFESAVVAEIYKQIKSSRLNINLYHLRSLDGREVDLLLESEEGFIPIEIKIAEKVTSTDARHLRNLETILDKPILHSFVVSNDKEVKTIEKGVTALPAAWFLT